MAYIRFPIPVFDHKKLRGLDWVPPAVLNEGEIKSKISNQTTYGGFTVESPNSLNKNFNIQGEHTHAILCIVPEGTLLVGRSYSWWLQRALVLDSLDGDVSNIIYDWRTPRPINNRFGPEEGVVLNQNIIYVASSHNYASHWVANRTLIENYENGLRILGTAKEGTSNFHEFCLTFSWS